ncbi:hypothetical protein [Kordia sp.]|uniref:hypothetical protein n=1 Tax=Kordia sp. TaxID=1965332 RepID=UPI003B5AECE0
MKSKLQILLFIFCLASFQNAEAQLFKRLKKKAKEKIQKVENDIVNKIDKKVDKTIDNTIEGKENPKKENSKETAPTANKEKDFGDVVINHSKTYGSVTLTEARQIKVDKTNSGYMIYGNWWSHKADIYDGFTIMITTDKNLKDNKSEKHTFKIPQEATLKIAYDPQLPYNKESEDGFSRAVTDDYQNYNISRGEVTIDVLSDEAIQISFSGTTSLRKVTRLANSDEYSEKFYEASVTGGIDAITPKFMNQETVTKNQNNQNTSNSGTVINTGNTNTAAAPGTYHFTHETVTKISVPEQKRTYNMSYLLNSNAQYIGIKADLSEYSDEEMNGESIIVMDKGDTHIFVETAGMKMRMSAGMMGQKMENPTDQMANFDYTKLQKTGNTKTILGATCHEYAMSDNSIKINFWVAPDVKLSNWFIQHKGIVDGYIMEYTVQSNEGTMKSETVAIKDHISKTINPKEYKKMF